MSFFDLLGETNPRKMSREKLYKMICEDKEYICTVYLTYIVHKNLDLSAQRRLTNSDNNATRFMALVSELGSSIEKKNIEDNPEIVALSNEIFQHLLGDPIATMSDPASTILSPAWFDSSLYLRFYDIRKENHLLYKEAKKKLKKAGGMGQHLVKIAQEIYEEEY